MVTLSIVLAAIGLLLLLAEVLLPGGIAGVAGLLILVLVICLLYFHPEFADFSRWAKLGMVSLLLLAIGLGVSFWMKHLNHLPFFKNSIVGELVPGPSLANDTDFTALVGQTGVAMGDLRPAGRVKISGKLHEACSSSGLIRRGSEVRVIAWHDSYLLVKEAPRQISSSLVDESPKAS